ncbi:unnamed protein product [Cochlearia groenlandica]
MGFERQSSSLVTSENSRAKFMSLFYIIILLCFVFLCVITTFITPTSLSSPYAINSISWKLGHFYAQEEERSTSTIMIKKTELRRILRGLGSFPPRCSSKCGRCTPCKPVRVTVPPGTPVTAEYYPEAWRCKCGNKLYMP